jgi:hypothetical protein
MLEHRSRGRHSPRIRVEERINRLRRPVGDGDAMAGDPHFNLAL